MKHFAELHRLLQPYVSSSSTHQMHDANCLALSTRLLKQPSPSKPIPFLLCTTFQFLILGDELRSLAMVPWYIGML